jgi:hypothetical protein
MMLTKHHHNWVAVLVIAASQTCCLRSSLADDLFFHYKAQQGDTLIGLGEAMLTRPSDWPMLAHINKIRNPKAIPVGTPLRIPVNLLRYSPRSGVILKQVGTVRILPPGSTTASPLLEQAPIQAGSTLETGDDGWITVALADGSVLRLAPSSQARFERTHHYEGAGFFASTLALIKGRMEALVAKVKGGEPRFEIKTPQAQLGVRGTSFRTTVDPDKGLTRGEVLTGSVWLGAGQPTPAHTSTEPTTTVLDAGFGALADAQAKVSPPIPLLPAPDMRAVPTLHERPLVRINMPTLPGAKAWHGEVAADADFRQVLDEANSATGELRFANLPDGTYHLKVRAADERGLQGMDGTTTFKLKARPEPPIPSGPKPKAKLRAKEVALSWAQQEQAARYHLQVTPAMAGMPPVLDDEHVMGATRTLALPPGEYTWRMASIRADGDRGPWGDAQHFVLKPLPPEAPPPKVTPTTLEFSWSGEEGQSFEFQVAKDRAFTREVQTQALRAPEAVVAKPATGGKLYIRYRAIDADGFVGPYTAPQLIDLPVCVQDRRGECVQSRDGQAVESR